MIFMAWASLVATRPLQSQAPGERPPDLRQAGRQADGGVLLPNGWMITPAGKQIALSTLPMSLALSPDEKYLLVLNGGFLPPTISVVDLAAERELERVPAPDAWLGLTFNQAGDKVYAGGGSRVSVFEYGFRNGKLSPGRSFPVVPQAQRREADHVGDVALSPDGRFLYAANLFRDSISVLNTETGVVVEEFKSGPRPYRILMGPDGKTLLASHWAGVSVALHALPGGRLIERIAVGPHPTDMLILPPRPREEEGAPVLLGRLFVACANTNSVWVFGITEGNRFQQLQRIAVGPTLGAPAGSTPTALAASADGNRLYVVCSDNNMIVALDVSQDRAEPVGAIPTGWYPTAVKAAADGRLFYLSGKGGGSQPAPRGPDPTRRDRDMQYVAAVQTGALGILPPLTEGDLALLTARVVANTPYDDRRLVDAGVPENSPLPARPGASSPIRNVVCVIKENRTYDQVLGDLEQGNGDCSLVVFGEPVTPNHHRLAREFVLFDNFYAEGDVSADGQNWSAAAMANDYVQKMWPSYYGRRRKVYDFEGGEPAAMPAAGYLWSNALNAGLSVRNYGMWSSYAPTGGGSGYAAAVNDPSLRPHSDPRYTPFDLSRTDGERVDEFLREFREFEAKGESPRLLVVRLPGDHTAGRSPGLPTARAMMAEHDYALGRLVEAVSNSRFWPQTAIFVVEDDAGDGADHVDSHRSPAFVISPYVKRGVVDSRRYSTGSVLRTMELILGLRPMTQFDAAAPPMSSAFQPEPDLRPYEAVRPQISFDEKNPPGEGGQPRRVEKRGVGKPSLVAFVP